MFVRIVLLISLAVSSLTSLAETPSPPPIEPLANTSEKTWAQLYEEALPSIPIIFPGICSGALISQRLVLTAAHCVSDVRPRSVTWRGSKGVDQAVVVYIDKSRDVAVLKLNTLQTRPLLSIFPESKHLREGEGVATIGHPYAAAVFASPPLFRDMTYLFSAGVISKVNEDYFLVDLSVSPGNSGGPVLNQEGLVTGITSRKVTRRSAGDIAAIVGPQAVQKIASRLPELEEKEELSFLRADSSWDLVLSSLYSQDLESDFSRDNPAYLGGLLFDWKDRLHLEYLSNFSNTLHIRQAGVGLKMVTSLKKKYYFSWTPLIEKTWYETDNKTKDVTKLALEVKYLHLPLLFKMNSQGDFSFLLELGL